jgi:hypothetical protein
MGVFLCARWAYYCILLMITCTKCDETKPESEFYSDKRRLSGFRFCCKQCQCEQTRCKYATDSDYRERKLATAEEYVKGRRREYQIRILTILKHTGCKDCGEKDPLVLDFDHMRDKTAGVSRLLRNNASWEDIEIEITKCEVRCSNCHRRKTARERNYYADIDLAIL